MRWLLIILLMCNGIYFVWQGYLVEQQEVQEQVKVDLLPEASAQLVLIKESSEEVVAEKELEPKKAVEPVSEMPDEPGLVEEEPAVCWMIGPFKEVVSGKQVAGRMASLDISLDVVELAVPGKPDYWVHIPPMPTRKLALKKLRELQSKKIDSFLVTEGELANGISLGFFTSEKRAQAVYKKRKKQGYGAEIRIVARTHTEIWLVSDQSENEKISDPLWEKIKEGNSGLERRKNYCNTIASIEKLE